ncbi:putative hydro-lyase [Paracoccus sp. S-4012]|uniref:putative hydro-lyase n=1 Tax=Paracoccus sp. S-4012 TaxID=2665648 RepID=UPI0012B08F9B|nr:putative hydro-lyase [Paracoccus sp. S-4012]MRX49684.1 putative hydro-lyase [Paracoccus sp. S-4012]
MTTATALAPDSPAALRLAIREGRHRGPTSGFCDNALQGNLAILPAEYADDFARFCALNPQPLPVLAQGSPGDPSLPTLGAEIDIRRDVPAYAVLRDGDVVATVPDLMEVWRDDLVTFVLGCSFSFESALAEAGIPIRHQHAGRNVAMYRTNIETRPAGPFGGPLVVSLRGIPADRVADAHAICARFPLAHGAPVHAGDPAAIGIADLSRPDWGDPPILEPGDVPVFWACGVTGQQALRHARLPFAITHSPGHMLVTDLPAA